MGLFSTLLGGGVGAMLGGPLGAIIGASIGGMLGGNKASDLKSGEKGQIAFFTCFFSVLAKIAKADGRVSEEEIDAVRDIIQRRLKLDAETANVTMKIFNAAIEDATDVNDYITQFGVIVKYNREVCQVLVSSMMDVSLADGRLSPGEEAIINSAKRILRLEEDSYSYSRSESQSNYHQRSNTISPKLQEAYKVLESTPDMEDSEIKKNYRTKVAKFHPDKIHSKGLPEEFMEFANNEMVKINEAYETVKSSRAI
ncbi:MAG: molecular chaperone DjlA [Candidatus Cloacimonetes bacterium 4572_65]|nr:MAG: molecular chaperone DjlA [Candidatus Cloacimonetes bacterium 4572_65]